LNCFTDEYSELWKYESKDLDISVLLGDINSTDYTIQGLREKGRQDQYTRYNILVELDVLVTMLMGLDINDLLSIYLIQFWVLKQNDKDTYYDQNGHIIFTPSKGLVGVGLPRKASKKDDPVEIEYPDGTKKSKPLGWEDICPDPAPTENGRRTNYADGNSYGKPKIPDGTKIHRTVMDDTLPGGPREKTITYVAPFYLPDREEDYRVAWNVFTERFKDKS
jgi:hypothetical protein